MRARHDAGRARVTATCPAVALQCELEQGHYEQVLSRTEHTHDGQALLARAEAARQMALRSLESLRDMPESAELHRFQAQVLRDQQKYQESTNELRRALALSPLDSAVQDELAGSLFLEQNYGKNLPELMTLEAGTVKSAKREFFVGHSLFEMQRIEEALPYLQRALKIDADFGTAHLSLGLSLTRLGRFSESIPHLKVALPLDQDGTLYYQLARAYQATGKPALAVLMMAEYQKRQQP